MLSLLYIFLQTYILTVILSMQKKRTLLTLGRVNQINSVILHQVCVCVDICKRHHMHMEEVNRKIDIYKYQTIKGRFLFQHFPKLCFFLPNNSIYNVTIENLAIYIYWSKVQCDPTIYTVLSASHWKLKTINESS